MVSEHRVEVNGTCAELQAASVPQKSAHMESSKTKHKGAERQPDYDYDGLQNLVGFLSVTDAQRLSRQDDTTSLSAVTLEQRARAEEWHVCKEVSTFISLQEFAAIAFPAVRPCSTCRVEKQVCDELM